MKNSISATQNKPHSSSLKVLHVCNYHRGGGGADNAWDATIRSSRENGFTVRVFARNSRDLPLGARGKVKAFWSGIYAREGIRDFIKVLDEFKPDVVHAHELYPLISPWILRACRKAGIPVVATVYDYRLTCPIATHFHNNRLCLRCLGGREYSAILQNCRNSFPESVAYACRALVARYFRLFLNNVSCYIVLTDFSRTWLSEKTGIPAERIFISPCMIPLPATPVDPAQGSYVGFAGRFVPEKGVDLLIKATRKLQIPLKLAGDSLHHPAARSGDNIEFILTRSPGELAEFYRNSKIQVVPSLWYETFGIVAAEAMSHGVAVIASRIGALQDTVEDEVTGLLFQCGDESDLEEKLFRLWNNDELCRDLGRRARMKVKTCFSSEAHVNVLVKAYEYAISHPNPNHC